MNILYRHCKLIFLKPCHLLVCTSLQLLSLLLFNFHGSKAHFVPPTNCPIYNCGNDLKFHYPFWKIEDSTAGQYCGYPGFGLNCSESGKPILSLPNNDSYYVKDINFIDSTVTLVDIDVFDQQCPRARHSISVGTLPLDYSPLDVNLSFYFNCTSFPGPLKTCLGLDGTKKSYVITEGEQPGWFDWSESCEENVVVTVMKTKELSLIIDELTGDFGELMKQGFVLNWTTAKECASCESGGGLCGYKYNPTKADEFLCFCKYSDGPCEKKGLSASSGRDEHIAFSSSSICRQVHIIHPNRNKWGERASTSSPSLSLRSIIVLIGNT